jgi:uncharacterized protein
MEVLDGIPFLSDWLAAHSDLHVQACFRNYGSAVVITWECCFNSPGFGIMEADSIPDLGASGTTLFLVRLPRIFDYRTSHDSVDASASLQSKYLVLQVFWCRGSHCCSCGHIVDRGKGGQTSDMENVRFPKPEYICLALAIPIGIGVLLSAGQYLFDRAQWMAQSFGTLGSPQFGSYFTLPDFWLLLLFFSAFVEEMIFRGFLQHRFVQRYGIYRGIFLVGVVWAAFHFFSDFSFVRITDQGAILNLASRIFNCVVLSYVLGWLTLRTGSILPASLAHAIYNVLAFSEFGQPFPGKSTLQVSLWGVLACVLFRYWPARTETGPEPTPEVGNLEPAV